MGYPAMGRKQRDSRPSGGAGLPFFGGCATARQATRAPEKERGRAVTK